MANLSSGRQWPYILGIAITLVFGMCVWTVQVTGKADIQESDAYMTKYQDADAKANKLIKAKQDFDARYTMTYTAQGLHSQHPQIVYTITDKDGNAVENANVKIRISRPDTEKFTKDLEEFTQKDGVYSFTLNKLPKEGIWNVMAKVSVDKHYRFLNLKIDTCSQKVYLESEFTKYRMQSYGCEKKQTNI